MTGKRHTASTITDDDLDALYANASRGWRRGDRWKDRALAAEAALHLVLGVAEVIEANGIKWAADSVRSAAGSCLQCGGTGACNGGPCPLHTEPQPEETSTT